MKVIILAGGFGTRLSEYTESIPKPMVKVGNHPILWHIMNNYASYGHKDFYVALGYKAEIIKEYFLNYRALKTDFTIDLSNGQMQAHNRESVDWRVTLVDTGAASMTGGRVKRMKSLIGDETFMLTYGDGLANVDIDALLKFHKSHGKLVTVSAVHPGARFGELAINNDVVESFQEKPQMEQGWINGGFFVIEPEFFNFIESDETILERAPLENAAKKGELMAYRHDGFWQCMDTKRDKDYLDELATTSSPPWMKP